MCRVWNAGLWGFDDDRRALSVGPCLYVVVELLRSNGGITTSVGFEMLTAVGVLAAGGVSWEVEVAVGYIMLGAAICSFAGSRLSLLCVPPSLLQCWLHHLVPVIDLERPLQIRRRKLQICSPQLVTQPQSVFQQCLDLSAYCRTSTAGVPTNTHLFTLLIDTHSHRSA